MGQAVGQACSQQCCETGQCERPQTKNEVETYEQTVSKDAEKDRLSPNVGWMHDEYNNPVKDPLGEGGRGGMPSTTEETVLPSQNNRPGWQNQDNSGAVVVRPLLLADSDGPEAGLAPAELQPPQGSASSSKRPDLGKVSDPPAESTLSKDSAKVSPAPDEGRQKEAKLEPEETKIGVSILPETPEEENQTSAPPVRQSKYGSSSVRPSFFSSAREIEELEIERDKFLDTPETPLDKQGINAKELATGVLFAILLLAFVYLTFMGYVQDAAVGAAELGPIGHLIFIVLYIFVAMPFGWGFSVVIIAGGFSFGWLGIISAEIGTLVGSFLAYILSMKAMSNWVRMKLKGMKPKTQKVLLSIELCIRQGKGGLGMQTGLRVNPILPFGWTNAVLGIWEVHPASFVASTMFGCQVDIVLKTNLGVIAKTVGDLSKQTPETKALVQTQLMIQCGVFAVVLIAGCAYSRWIMKNINNQMPEEDEGEVVRVSEGGVGVAVKEVSRTSKKELADKTWGEGPKGRASFVQVLFRKRGNTIMPVMPVSWAGGVCALILVIAREQKQTWVPEMKHPFCVQLWAIVLSSVIVARTSLAIDRYYRAIDDYHKISTRWVDAFTSLLGFLRTSFDHHPKGSNKQEACVALGLAMLHWGSLAHALAVNSLQCTQLGLEEEIWMDRITTLAPPQNISLDSAAVPVGPRQSQFHGPVGGNNSLPEGRAVISGGLEGDRKLTITPEGVAQLKEVTGKTRPLVKLAVYGEVSPEELTRISGATDKVAIVLMWMEEAISRAQVQGTLMISPPILGRVYGELGHGLQGFNSAFRVALVPFPFCFSQLIGWCLVIFVFLCPITSFVFTGGQALTSTLTFCSLMGFWGVNRIALELENPFGQSPNHLPLAEMHHVYVEALGEMHGTPMPEYQWDGITTINSEGKAVPLPGMKRNLLAD